jgi:fucokinase
MSSARAPDWDYLILTASNHEQARAYESQLRLRRGTGPLQRVSEALVIADPDGKRIGSGASTIYCLARVMEREGGGDPAATLRRLRILIVHAGGDSRRLPAYSPCGKIFVPVPGDGGADRGLTIFDRLAPAYLDLPPGRQGAGQVVVGAGDALLQFDAGSLRMDKPGMTLAASHTDPEEASRHGVYCVGENGTLRLYLQKPSMEVQQTHGALDRAGRAALDIGIMSFDADIAAALLRTMDFEKHHDEILRLGIDLYREICCAFGTQATFAHYLQTARDSGSRWPEAVLEEFYPSLHAIETNVQVLPRARFLHFGASAQLISSGYLLAGLSPDAGALSLNNQIGKGGSIEGCGSWVEGCVINAPLTLGGHNVVCGVDIDQPLALPAGACLDVLPIHDRAGKPAWAVRCYGVEDSFKDSRWQGRPLPGWIGGPSNSTVWDAAVFPAVESPADFWRWLWMLDVHAASADERQALLAADRYSAAELAMLADQEAFQRRRVDSGSYRR